MNATLERRIQRTTLRIMARCGRQGCEDMDDKIWSCMKIRVTKNTYLRMQPNHFKLNFQDDPICA